ncbi:MAG: hypothetical protein GY941_30610 [Planctomycetes bacterium]|nr:hypothetical protein [Planctomycetota bacterium]
MKYSSYKTGILEIDIQHANIDFLLLELSKEVLENKAKEEIYDLLKNAIASHFDYEEEWAKRNNKILDLNHKKSHTEILEELNEFGNQYTNNNLSMYEISLTLKMRLLRPVQNHDIKLSV